jgi:L-threonylcarbamoyladenylate synthase
MTPDYLSTRLAEQIGIAARILKGGGVVAYPTDTVYGLGASALNDRAVDRIYSIKQRPRNLPFPVLLADKSDLEKLVIGIPGIANTLIDRFWPGGLTLVMKKKLSPLSADSISTIAIRIPAHPIPIALIREIGAPLIGTSANISGQPNTISAEEVQAQLGGIIDFTIDGGICPGGTESTVVDVTGLRPVIVRHGAIPESAIMAIIKEYQDNEATKCA